MRSAFNFFADAVEVTVVDPAIVNITVLEAENDNRSEVEYRRTLLFYSVHPCRRPSPAKGIILPRDNRKLGVILAVPFHIYPAI